MYLCFGVHSVLTLFLCDIETGYFHYIILNIRCELLSILTYLKQILLLGQTLPQNSLYQPKSFFLRIGHKIVITKVTCGVHIIKRCNLGILLDIFISMIRRANMVMD